jgi:hypothetical protein
MGYFCNFQTNLYKVSYHPIGENSTNVVTLQTFYSFLPFRGGKSSEEDFFKHLFFSNTHNNNAY